ncbi:hypothetical protein MC126_004508 [Salmonella enterica]|nr:hypothetical protein [Salmonella enterica]ECX8345124.1 hypothetical protein [Salmonella enterica]EIW3598933.1 hypothetical protein [Salmonella enterica]
MKDDSGVSINTRQLAELLEISEGELIHAMRSTGHLYGVAFPAVIGNHKAKVRKFNLAAAIRFAEQVKEARKGGLNSESA